MDRKIDETKILQYIFFQLNFFSEQGGGANLKKEIVFSM